MSDNPDPIPPVTPAPIGATEAAPGVVSMMRKGVQAAIRLGQVVTYSAIVLAGVIAWQKTFELIPLVITMLSTGPGLIALALGAKAWQAQAEAQGQ